MSRGRKTLLVADPDPTVVNRIREVISEKNGAWAVESAATLREGHDRLVDGGVDCIVSAYRLPDGTGLDFLEAVREDNPSLPFVLFPAEGSEAVAAAAIDADVTAYVPRDPSDRCETVVDRVESHVRVDPNHDGESKRTGTRAEYDRELADFALDVTDSVVYDVDLATGETMQYGPTDRLFGTDPDDVEAFVSQVVHPDDREELQSLFENVRRGDTDEFDSEFRVVAGDNGRWFRSCGLVRESEESGARHLVGLTTDVTELKQRERELRRHNDRLEAFARVVSHDLRNPLETATGRLGLLRSDCDSEHVPPIERALDRIERIVDVTLTMARGDRSVGEREVVDVDRLGERCWQTAVDGGATLQVESGLAVVADRDRVAHVFENLFGNAVEHGDDVTVRVGTLADESGFYVADDGPGIPEEDRDEVFEFGYTTSSEGSGFGLGIVREIAAAHGWDVSVTESREGGARFEVTGVEFADAQTDTNEGET